MGHFAFFAEDQVNIFLNSIRINFLSSLVEKKEILVIKTLMLPLLTHWCICFRDNGDIVKWLDMNGITEPNTINLK